MNKGQRDYRLAPFKEGETIGFQVIRESDRKVMTGLRGGEGIYTFRAQGVSQYRPALQQGDYEPGQPVTLIAEPENPHDPNAVSIWDRNRQHKVGYVRRASAEKLSPRLKSGADVRAYVLRIDRWKGGRAHLDILVVDMEEAGIDLPEDPTAPLPGSETMAKKAASGCATVIAFLLGSAATGLLFAG